MMASSPSAGLWIVLSLCRLLINFVLHFIIYKGSYSRSNYIYVYILYTNNFIIHYLSKYAFMHGTEAKCLDNRGVRIIEVRIIGVGLYLWTRSVWVELVVTFSTRPLVTLTSHRCQLHSSQCRLIWFARLIVVCWSYVLQLVVLCLHFHTFFCPFWLLSEIFKWVMIDC